VHPAVSPDSISKSNALEAAPPGFEVIELGVKIAGDLAGWACQNEINEKGWREHVTGEQLTS
jgi:hypothetical protein